ncbi:hypothetical protein [Paenibacillus eucommiae]|uniref:Uncharacterized protein n=1 Tax=Paenibacillus eucommiae TaxID=1355755 RepID=A0ABS4IZQ3_9BACL|nr:hypothetical protein [Paenibacillus eucommiae]MBP1993030.1 hypothetical protein [Paenibacillus eucommiae]
MILPNGITGFYDSKNNKPPYVDGKQFKQICFAIATDNGGEVLEFREPQYPMNFYNVKVEIFNNHFHILLNEHYHYLAFAAIVEFGYINFIDESRLLKSFSSFYKVLSTKELNEPLLPRHELNTAELAQVAYWKPEKIGEVIYNYWD